MFSLLQSRTGVVHIALKMTRIKAVVDRVAATVVALFPILSEGVKYKFENYANTELGRQKPRIEDRLLYQKYDSRDNILLFQHALWTQRKMEVLISNKLNRKAVMQNHVKMFQ